jgi:hypothetical protein
VKPLTRTCPSSSSWASRRARKKGRRPDHTSTGWVFEWEGSGGAAGVRRMRMTRGGTEGGVLRLLRCRNRVIQDPLRGLPSCSGQTRWSELARSICSAARRRSGMGRVRQREQVLRHMHQCAMTRTTSVSSQRRLTDRLRFWGPIAAEGL